MSGLFPAPGAGGPGTGRPAVRGWMDGMGGGFGAVSDGAPDPLRSPAAPGAVPGPVPAVPGRDEVASGPRGGGPSVPARWSAEGFRAMPLRVSVYLRWVAYMLVTAVCSAVTGAALRGADTTFRAGGTLMFLMAALMFATAAAGTLFLTTHRNEILEQLRHFLFGIVVFPGTGIAVLLWVVGHVTASSDAGDVFTKTLNLGLAGVFVMTVVVPPAIFVKAVWGMRTLYRSRMDDQEMVAMFTRQDGKQR